MSWLSRFLYREPLERNLDAELRFDFEERVAAKIRSGMDTAQARRAARLEFGGLEQVKEECRDARGVQLVDSVLQDIRYALRGMRRSPAFTFVAVMTLAIGIGVNATVFTVTNAVLFKGFAKVQRNDRLLYISYSGCCVSYPDFEDYRARAKSFEGLGITHGIKAVFSDDSGFTERHDATEVSSNVFSLVGQGPVAGRDFNPADDKPGATPVAMLSYGFWESRYGKNPDVIGRTARINGVATVLIGVMPEGFLFPQKTEVWLPLVATPAVAKRDNRGTWFVFGRLTGDASVESARAEIENIGKQLATEYPVTNKKLRPSVQNFTEFFIGPRAAMIYGSMWGAVGFVLLIACANLANLLLARAIGRSREISLRMALGAGRWRIVRQLLIESVVLSALGGFFGWWIAQWGVHAYESAMVARASWLIVDYNMDHRVLEYLIAISMGTGVLFGLAPALRLSGLDINANLKDGARGFSGGVRARYLSFVLVAGELALALVLLSSAGVMIRSFLKIHSAAMGVQSGNVVIASMNLPASKYVGREARTAFYRRLQGDLEATPGVESATIADALPSWPASKIPYEVDGDSAMDARSRPTLPVVIIGTDYFRTLQAPVLSGRTFNEADRPSGLPVVVVNQRFAAEQWHGENPLGKRLRLFDKTTPGAWLTVAGVVGDIVQNDANREEFGPVVYLPYQQNAEAEMWVYARYNGSRGSVETALRREVQTLDSELPMGGPFSLQEHLEKYWDSRFYGLLFSIFAGIALLLAAIGLYTVIAHSVAQRTQEIGIRMAIGATARQVHGLVFRQGMLPLGIGLCGGIAGALAVNRLVKSILVQVSPNDPVTLAVASVALILAAMLGCWIPARRAMRVDPVVALRHD